MLPLQQLVAASILLLLLLLLLVMPVSLGMLCCMQRSSHMASRGSTIRSILTVTAAELTIIAAGCMTDGGTPTPSFLYAATAAAAATAVVICLQTSPFGGSSCLLDPDLCMRICCPLLLLLLPCTPSLLLQLLPCLSCRSICCCQLILQLPQLPSV